MASIDHQLALEVVGSGENLLDVGQRQLKLGSVNEVE